MGELAYIVDIFRPNREKLVTTVIVGVLMSGSAFVCLSGEYSEFFCFFGMFVLLALNTPLWIGWPAVVFVLTAIFSYVIACIALLFTKHRMRPRG
jgi:hypothetical protein